MKNKRTFYMSLMLLIAVCFSIGYAFLSQSLKINGRAGIASNSWIIYFDNLLERSGSIEATSPAVINAAKDQIDFGITLDKPGDNYTFEVDIINNGSIDAMIDSVSMSGIPSSLNGIVEWKVNYLTGEELQRCDELLANSKRRIKVVVNYNKDIEELPDEQDLNLTFTVKYVQLDNTECTVTNPAGIDPIDTEDGRHTLTIDPNYGLYDGSDAVKTVRMVPGEVYVLADPIQEVHTFTGWTVDKPDTYNETSNVITMDDEDINATAEWEWIITDEENNMGYCFGVGDNYFYNFDEAISAAGNDGTIKLLSNGCTIKNRFEDPKDLKVGEDPYENESLKNVVQDVDITFDLNGHNVNWEDTLYNFAKFTIEDDSNSKKGEIIMPEADSDSYYLLGMVANNEAGWGAGVELNLNDIKVTDNRKGLIVRAQFDCVVRINGGTYTTNGGNNDDGTLVYSSSENNEIYIYDAVVNVNTNAAAVWVYSGSYLEIDNTIFNASYKDGGYHGVIYMYSAPKDYSLNNIDINVNVDSGNAYGMWIQPAVNNKNILLKNINVNMVGSTNNMNVGIYASSDSATTYSIMNSKVNMDIDGTNGLITSIYGPDGKKFYFENFDVDIKYKGSNNLFGIYVPNMEYNGGSINVDALSANTAYCVYGYSASIINNANISCNVTGSVSNLYGIYSGNLEFKDSELDIDANVVSSLYRIIDCNTCNVDNISINTSLNNSGSSGAYQGLYFESGNNNERLFNNINLTTTLKNSSQYTYGFMANGATIENLDLTVNVPASNHSGKNVGFKLDNSTLKHSSLKANVESTSSFYGVECTECTLDDVDIGIDYNPAGGSPVYGINGSDMDIKDSKLKINNSSNIPVYGVYSTNSSSISGSTIDIKTPGRAQIYGIFGKDITSNNNDIKIELLNVNAPLYGYNLSGESNITGGKIDVIGPVYPYENIALMKMLNAVQSSDSLNISDYTINSKYSCVNFTGSTLTTNGVNMTCGGYGIQKGDESVVNSTETVVNAELE